MRQTEIDDISREFSAAWEEFFGQEMYYVPMTNQPDFDPLYREYGEKQYDFAGKKKFFGTLKDMSEAEKVDAFGADSEAKREIAFVSLDLESQGVSRVDDSGIIEVTEKDGKTYYYNIEQVRQTVQFGSTRVFTKLGVNRLDKAPKGAV